MVKDDTATLASPLPDEDGMVGDKRTPTSRKKTIRIELLIARRVLELAPNRLFLMIVANMSNLPKSVHKHTKLAELTERPSTMVNMVEDFPTDVSDDLVNAVHLYKRKFDRDEQFRLHQEKRTAGKAEEQDAWRHQMSFNPKYDEYRPMFEKMMSKCDSMRDGHSERVSIINHRI